MTNATIGHNGGPELDDSRKLSIRTRWAKALFADPQTPSYVMAIAWAIHWYSKSDGTGAALSNAQLELYCGISSATATRGKAWLRDHGYVQLTVGTGTTKTKFRLAIPEIGVITEIAPSDCEDLQRDDGFNQADEAGVITETTNIQERDSVIQDHKRDRRSGNTNFWRDAFNPPHESIGVDKDGLPFLNNGKKAEWLDRFDGDAGGLDLALIQIATFVQPNSNRPLPVQIESQLARIVADRRDRDKRYARAAAKGRGVTTEQPKESAADRFARYLEEDSKPGGAA